MRIYKGFVKNNTVILEEGAQIPDGTRVEVRLIESPSSREEAFARVLANPIRHYVGIDEIIEEEKKEQEEHPD